MKSKTFYASILITGLFLSVAGSGCVTARPQQVQAGVSFSAFYDALSPYGQWMNYGNYGQVWIPDAGQDFRPYYTNGHWVYTDYGWTWMSDYPWGWAPFHYGRWAFDNYYGWMWVPGEEWGPAWVSWRNSNDYYGWAPLTPGVSVGVNVNFGIPASYWSFVPCRYISSPNIHNYYVDRSRNVTIINNTTIINNVRQVNRGTRYYRGPEANEVSRVTRQPVRPVRVVNSDRPGSSLSNNQLRIFRPQGDELRRPLADNGRPRRVNDSRDNRAPNNAVSQPGTPGRTIRRNDDNNNNPVTPNNTVPRRINEPDNRSTVPPRPNPDANPVPNNNVPRRTTPNNSRPSVTPAPTPNNRPTTAPSNPAPRRSFPSNDRPAPTPAPSQPRSTQPRPSPAPRPQPQSQPQRSVPQRTMQRPSSPAPAQRMQQQSSSPRPQSAPQRVNNGRVNRER